MSPEGASTRLSVVIVDDSRAVLKVLAEVISSAEDMRLAATATTGQDGLRRALELEPDVVLMDINLSDADGIQVAWTLSSRLPNCSVIIISSEDSSAVVQRAMLAGAQAYLTKPVAPETVLETIRNVRVRHAERLSRMMGVRRVEVESGEHRGDRRGRRIVVFGAKGGVGKTTIAANLAVALRMRTSKDVAAIDADFSFGDLSLHLNAASRTSIVDLLPRLGDLDSALLDRVMALHPSGVRVLVAPPRPEQAEMIKADHLNRLLTTLPRFYDYIVVDCQHRYDDVMLAALDDADLILLVLTPEIGPIRNSKHFLRLANILGYGRDRVMLVLNRSDSQVGISFLEIERALEVEKLLQVPSGGRAVAVSVNEGNPLVMTNPKHPWSKAIHEIAQQVEVRLASVR